MFLCLPLVVYEGFVVTIVDSAVEEDDDPWRSLLEDIAQWASTAKIWLLIGVILVSTGASSALAGHGIQSTYFCSPAHDSPVWTIILQSIGLGLDATIAILVWRVMYWMKTAKARFHILFELLRTCTAIGGGVYLLSVLFGYSDLRGLFFVDVAGDGLAFGAFVVALCLLMCDSSPLTPISMVIATTGILASFDNIADISKWFHGTRSGALTPLYLICIGFFMVLLSSQMRALTIVGRLAFVFVLLTTIISCLIITMIDARTLTFNRHPLKDQIYRSRIEMDRWLIKASTSQSLRIAAQIYKEKNYDRKPPPKFDVWYEFALERKSVIIDGWDQISDDILPFWGLDPNEIRARIRELEGRPDIAMVRVRNGGVSVDDGYQSPSVDQLVSIISASAQHLPDMDIPVNILEQPRVLGVWETKRDANAAARKHLRSLQRRDENGLGSAPQPPEWSDRSVAAWHRLERQGCNAGSKVRERLGVWTATNVQFSNFRSHSKGAHVTNWAKSMQTCLQGDSLLLHGFHMSTPAIRKPFTKMLPVFSRSKSDAFGDILIPLPRDDEDYKDSVRSFGSRYNRLYWRGSYGGLTAGYRSLRGNQKHRLVHLVNNATATDTTLIMLPAHGKGKSRSKFEYQKVPTYDLNKAMPFDIAFDREACPHPDYKPCSEFPSREADDNPLKNRYVLVMDDDDGPQDGLSFVRAMRSGSVPLVSTIFREWWTERVRPWVHFVPVDVRLHGLHSTFAYFSGLDVQAQQVPELLYDDDHAEDEQVIKVGSNHAIGGTTTSNTDTISHHSKKDKRDIRKMKSDVLPVVGGHSVDMNSAVVDARWIASQGQRWASKALRREDMEVYVFRLLLEWGRILDDQRDDIGFVYEEGA